MDHEHRWDPCVAHRGDEVKGFVDHYLAQPDRKVLLVVGVGFDPRSRVVATQLSNTDASVRGLFIRENRPDPSPDQLKRANVNMEALRATLTESQVEQIEIFGSDGATVGGHNVINVIRRQNLAGVSDVIVDASALSTGTSFPIIRYFVERIAGGMKGANLHVFVVHDPCLDARIRSTANDEPRSADTISLTSSGDSPTWRAWRPRSIVESTRRRAIAPFRREQAGLSSRSFAISSSVWKGGERGAISAWHAGQGANLHVFVVHDPGFAVGAAWIARPRGPGRIRSTATTDAQHRGEQGAGVELALLLLGVGPAPGAVAAAYMASKAARPFPAWPMRRDYGCRNWLPERTLHSDTFTTLSSLTTHVRSYPFRRATLVSATSWRRSIGQRSKALGPSIRAILSTPTREIRWISIEPFSGWMTFASRFLRKPEVRCSFYPHSAAR